MKTFPDVCTWEVSLEIIAQSRQLPSSQNFSLMTIKLVYFKNFFCNKESDKVLREVDLPICKVLFSIFTKIYFLFYFILCVWVFCLHAWLCSTCVSGIRRGQKQALGPLELESWMLISYHVGADNQALVLWKAARALTIISPALCFQYFWEKVLPDRPGHLWTHRLST